MNEINDFFDRLTEGSGIWQNKINGRWLDSLGWNVITQPKLGEPSSEDFNVRIDQMRETFIFKKRGRTKNIGVTGEAEFWQAISYEIDIKTPNEEEIHHEIGHFLLNVLEDGAAIRIRPNEPVGIVIRQASVPRAISVMTTGELRPESIIAAIEQQDFPFYNAKPEVSDEALQSKIDEAFLQAQVNIDANDGPDITKPLEWLSKQFPDTEHGIDWVFAFRDDEHPTQMANGQKVLNPVGIGKLFSDFWIAKRQNNDHLIDILQYTQRVDLKFNGVDWPHLAVNTLIRQPS